MTVADTIKNLTTVEKLEPLDVRVVPHELTRKSALRYHGSNLILWLIRSLIVWGVLAVFFPALGATYVAVMFGLWAIRHVLPPNTQDMIYVANKL